MSEGYDGVAGAILQERKVGFLLGIGILFMPYIFGWVVAGRGGYTPTTKKVVVIWMVLGSILAFSGVSQKPTERVESSATAVSATSAQQEGSIAASEDDNSLTSPMSLSDREWAEKIYSSEKGVALGLIDDFATGTWTFIGDSPYWWRFVIQPDGLIVIYMAPPVADNWGEPVATGQLEPTTDKYPDTGKRWYGFTSEVALTSNGKTGVYSFLITQDGQLIRLTHDGMMPLERKDVHPFSN